MGPTGCPRMFYTVFQKNVKNRAYQINNEPNYNRPTCKRMFDMCSSYCENFIYIYLSIAM